MPRVCFALDLNDDPELIAAYEQHHVPGSVWAEVIEGIRAQGYRQMQIWRVDDRLMMVADVEDVFPRAPLPMRLADADARWQAQMDRYQRRLPHAPAGVKWVPMKCIFDLDHHDDTGPEVGA